jgi:hypothetical protein
MTLNQKRTDDYELGADNAEASSLMYYQILLRYVPEETKEKQDTIPYN